MGQAELLLERPQEVFDTMGSVEYDVLDTNVAGEDLWPQPSMAAMTSAIGAAAIRRNAFIAAGGEAKPIDAGFNSSI